MLKIRNLSKDFGGIAAVNRCNLTVEKGSITGLIGPNGAGKTTIFNLITGYYPPSGGRIYFKDRRIDSLKPHEIASRGIGRTFQLVRLFHDMTALENLLCACRNSSGENVFPALVGLRKMKDTEYRNTLRCMEILNRIGLADRAGDKTSDLSFGDQKLMEIARVLALDPSLILLDEPMAGIDPAMKRKLVDLIRQLRNTGKTFLVIEHDMRTIMDICDKIVVLVYGKEIAAGPPTQIQADQKVIEAYLGVKKENA